MSKAIIILAILFSFTANSQQYVSDSFKVTKIETRIYDSTGNTVAKILPSGELIVTDSLQTILILLREIKEQRQEIRNLRSVASQLYERFKQDIIQSPLKIELHE